ncbi:MAG: tetratricopeptide repeat protein [Chloroflexi bacterium]|nr:tetratricopeptide repeat protein [Chloroflexota bacterium]MDA8217221.1 tetratricopeptide repeat protein [Dehalococcoidales bacterium]
MGSDSDPAEAALGSVIVGEAQAQLARSYLAKYPELDFTYCRLGRHYLASGQFERAREVLDQGLAACPRRRRLCLQYAALEYEAGRLAAAVAWWLRSAERQLAVERIDGPEAFTHLAYTAMLLGHPQQAQQLLAFADRSHVFRLSEQAKEEMQTLAKNLDRKKVGQSIAALARQLPQTG